MQAKKVLERLEILERKLAALEGPLSFFTEVGPGRFKGEGREVGESDFANMPGDKFITYSYTLPPYKGKR
jgi:hypothetical protein